MERLLDVRGLSVTFATYDGLLKVLDNVNLAVHEQEKVGLVGEAGCGKTTTMKCIARVLPIPPADISSGEILIRGENILKANLRKVHGSSRYGASMIFQDPTAALNPVFTVGHQLTDALKSDHTSPRLGRSALRQRAVKALHAAALPDPERIMRNYPVQLSGGMRQRVCIALALATARELLIADEPGTSLDVTIRDQILRLLDQLVSERKLSVILISHALGAVKNLADRVNVMYAGTIVESARTPDFFSRPRHPYAEALLRTVPRLTGGGIAPGIPGRIPDYLTPPSGCRFHPRCPHVMEICGQERPEFYDLGGGRSVACFLYRNGVEKREA
jgi:peptide/nickel transport system ATP-binding protein